MRDRIGDRSVLVFQGILIILGQIIFVYGIILKNFWVMYLGRIILGWGIEDIVPTETSFISKYFKEDYLVLDHNHNI
jgi:MFS family permease